MSKTLAMQVLSRLNCKPTLVDGHFNTMQTDLKVLASHDEKTGEQAHQNVMESLCQAYGFSSRGEGKPFLFSGGVAVIPVHGSLINRFGSSWGDVTGYNYIRRMTKLAMEDADVQLVVFDHNSGGGEVSGAFETAKMIYDYRGTKPTMAVVDAGSYSASYMQAVAADKIYVTPTGGVGSVGVWTMHVNMSKLLSDWGIEVTLISSGEHKVDGHPFAALPDSVRADIQASVDKTRGKFVSLVAEYRGLDEKVIFETEGRTYDADAALELGLIDGIATPIEAIQTFFNNGADDMSQAQASTTDTAQGATATVDTNKQVADGQLAERARIKAITTSAEAVGREGMANHLAYETNMSADDAVALMAKAPVTSAGSAAASSNASPFAQAMAGTQNPGVTADASAADGGGQLSAADQLMADAAGLSGVKFRKQ